METWEYRILAARTVGLTCGGLAWSLALTSWLCTFEWSWNLRGAIQAHLRGLGVAGHGHCWLCGMSHAFRSLWKGDFREAVEFNPHAPIVFGLMIVGCLSVFCFGSPIRGLFRKASYG